MPPSVDEARKELARRELERRRGGAAPDIKSKAAELAAQFGATPAHGQGLTHPEFNPADAQRGHSLVEDLTQLGMQGFGVGPKPPAVDAVARGIADIPTLGMADEFAAKMDELTGRGGDYETNLTAERARDASDLENVPLARIGGQVAGGIMMAPFLPTALPNAISLGGRMLGGALTGAGYSAAHGFGSGEDGVQNRILQALKEGGMGAAVGGALPLASDLASGAYRKIVDMLSTNRTAKDVGASPETLRLLSRVMDADGTMGPTGQQNIAAAGPDGMLADAGPNARAVLDTAIQRGGPGATTARDRIAERVAGSSDDLVGALDDTLGVPQGVTATQTGIRAGSAAARGSAYDDAYAAAIDYSKPAAREIEEIVKTRVPASAIKAANELMRAEGQQSAQILADIAEDGTVTLRTLPDVRQLDYITRGLNEVADAANSSGKLGGTTATGRAYGNLSREIRDRLKSLVPEYETALATAADPIRRSQAVELGSRLLSPAMRRDEVAEAIAGMTVAERDAVSQGVRSQIDDLMANVTRTVQDGDVPAREAIKALKDLSSRASREKLELLLGDRAAPLFEKVDRIARSFDLRAAVAENSKTYARLATDRSVQDMTEPGILSELGNPLDASKRIVQTITGARPAERLARQDAIYSEIADLLTRRGGGVYDAVSKVGKTDEATKLITDRIARALSSRAAYPLATQLETLLPEGRRR